MQRLRSGDDVLSLRTFLALHDREAHALAFDQALVAFADDLLEVSENVSAAFARDETKTFRFIEPFYGASGHDGVENF